MSLVSETLGAGRDTHAKIISASALVSIELPEPRWAVPNLIPEGFNLLVGKPKLGKSWMALSIALAITNGRRVFGEIEVEAGEVLYLALEDNRRRLQDRLKKILGGAPAPDSLHLVTEWPRLKDGGLELLEDWVKMHSRCRLIITDTLARLRPPHVKNADAYEEDGMLGAMLQALGQKHHLAVVAIHHTRKAKASDAVDTVLGSTGLTGAADSIAILTRRRGARDAALIVTGRDLDEQEINLSFDEETCEWKTVKVDSKSMLSPERKAIVGFLEKAGRAMSPKEIAASCELSHDSVKHLVRALLRDGHVVSKEDGTYAAAHASAM
jgi:RecA-family ATPase